MEVTETAMQEALQRGDTATALRIADTLDQQRPAVRVSILGAALWYGEQGLPVFPIQPGTKIPYRHTRGVLDASTDADRIRAMFDGKTGANLAIATGHLVDVIDFDGPEAHAAWGLEFPTWESAGIDPLGSVSTPRPGGLHIYIRATGQGNRAGMLPGVDYRGHGGYVLAPPSLTAVGTYDWLIRPLALS